MAKLYSKIEHIREKYKTTKQIGEIQIQGELYNTSFFVKSQCFWFFRCTLMINFFVH